MVDKKDWSKGVAWLNGQVMPIGEAAIPVTDWGLTHSDITYDVVHVWDKRFFRIDDYLQRFEQSLEKCRLQIDQNRSEIKNILHKVVARSGLDRSYVSMVASRGQPSVPGSRDPRDCENYFYAWCVPFVWVFKEEVISRGAWLQIPEQITRISQTSVDPTAKNYHWGDFTQGLIDAKDAGFDNTLLLDDVGNITEGPGFNVFMIKDGQVKTPKSGVLEGITRKVAMEICTHLHLEVERCDIARDELLQADEIFATTTGGGPVAISRIDDHTFSNDAPGEITRSINETYWQWHKDPAMSEEVGSF